MIPSSASEPLLLLPVCLCFFCLTAHQSSSSVAPSSSCSCSMSDLPVESGSTASLPTEALIVCVCVCETRSALMSYCLAESPLEGESVAQLTPDPAMLHKTQLTTPRRGCVCVPLFPRVSLLPLKQQRRICGTFRSSRLIFSDSVLYVRHRSLYTLLPPDACFSLCGLTVRVI